MHKYLPDQSLGSSWHPWIRDGVAQLPIQEDETALVVWALAEHYKHSRDLEFIEALYNSLFEKAANFMAVYRDPLTGLPKPSYDLWEERRGVSTFSSSSVFGALVATAHIAKILGKDDRERFYLSTAEEIRTGILTHLFDTDTDNFLKMIEFSGHSTTRVKTMDISTPYGLFAFGVLDPDDQRLKKSFSQTVARLSSGGGIGRYENDHYYSTGSASNPWFITTLWYAEYLIACAKKEEDFVEVIKIFDWVVKHTTSSGILSEQVRASDNSPCSVAPLTWSHAAYVNAVLKYLDKLKDLGICQTCNPTP